MYEVTGQEYSPSFLVSIVATIGGNLAHVPPGKHVLSSPCGRGTHVLFYVPPAQPVLPVKKLVQTQQWS